MSSEDHGKLEEMIRIGFLLTTLLPCTLAANGVLRWGYGAGDLGAAGAFGGTRGDAVAAMQVNPAALTFIQNREITTSVRYLHGESEFLRGGQRWSGRDGEGAYPDFALGWRLHPQVVLGFGASVISGLEAEWDYPDVLGGIGGISFGEVEHESRFVAVRLALGLGWQVTDHFSLGLSAGAVRSEVNFNAPFIFQTNPALANAKVDLDLDANDWSPTITLGARYELTPDWIFGARVNFPISLDHRGSAEVDFSAQLPALGLSGTPPLAQYDAHAAVELPLTISVGGAWQVSERWSLGAWLDWHHWSDSYDVFPVQLTGGSNAAINRAIGVDVSDRVPLAWKDRFVIALGAECQLSDEWTVRGGWRYGESPIPNNLVTPLNGAIMEQAFTLGASWQRHEWTVDLAYAYEFSPTARIGTSGYNAGEYSNSSFDVDVHHFSLGLTRQF